LKGLSETGVTLFQLDEGVDTGPILAQERLSIAPDETATTLYERVAAAHQDLISKIWSNLVQDHIEAVPQDSSKATIWPGRTPEDGRITLAMSIGEVDRLVRATTRPYPGAFLRSGEKTITIWRGVIGDSAQPTPEGSLRLYLSNGVFDAVDYEVRWH
jgi:methionyl-tRNA formyltransferase